jgi:hypothetical protein
MCRDLDVLRKSITTYASRFDASSLIPSQASQVVRVCAQMEASVASIKALAAVRAAEGNDWKSEGYRSQADQLAQTTGTSSASAKRTLDTGRRLAGQPEVAQAALAGELSAEQTAAVSDGVEANPAKAGELIERAKHASMVELNEEVARIKAAATDQEARRKAIHAKRSLRRWTDRDGAFHAHLYGNPEDGAGLWQMLDPIRRRLIVLRRGSTSNEPLDAVDYDAIMTMAAIASGRDSELSFADLLDLGLFPQAGTSHPTNRPAPTPGPASSPPPSAVADEPDLLSSLEDSQPVGDPSVPPDPPDLPPGQGRRAKKLAGSPARVMIRVDLDTLLRGVPMDGELCEIVGYGPIPVSVVEELLANGNTFVVGVMTRSHQIQGIYHHGRHPNAHQRSALDFLYPSCAVQGCSTRAGLQSDHRQDWIKTKYTVLDFLDRLCVFHHKLKTHKGWGLVAGTGKRDFVPPDDPRHPRHHPDTQAPSRSP